MKFQFTDYDEWESIVDLCKQFDRHKDLKDACPVCGLDKDYKFPLELNDKLYEENPQAYEFGFIWEILNFGPLSKINFKAFPYDENLFNKIVNTIKNKANGDLTVFKKLSIIGEIGRFLFKIPNRYKIIFKRFETYDDLYLKLLFINILSALRGYIPSEELWQWMGDIYPLPDRFDWDYYFFRYMRTPSLNILYKFPRMGEKETLMLIFKYGKGNKELLNKILEKKGDPKITSMRIIREYLV